MTEALTLTLAEFLLARIGEDERFARDAGAGEWESWNRPWDDGATRDLAANGARLAELPITLDEHICRWHPARVLAECEAKRRMVALAEGDAPYRGEQFRMYDAAGELLRLLALPCSDHPDFRDEWRP